MSKRFVKKCFIQFSIQAMCDSQLMKLQQGSVLLYVSNNEKTGFKVNQA